MVVARQRHPLPTAQPLQAGVPERPAELAVHVVRIRFGGVGAGVRGQDPHVVPVRAQVLDGGLPHQLVPAVVVWGVHIADGQDPHGGEDRVGARPAAPIVDCRSARGNRRDAGPTSGVAPG